MRVCTDAANILHAPHPLELNSWSLFRDYNNFVPLLTCQTFGVNYARVHTNKNVVTSGHCRSNYFFSNNKFLAPRFRCILSPLPLRYLPTDSYFMYASKQYLCIVRIFPFLTVKGGQAIVLKRFVHLSIIFKDILNFNEVGNTYSYCMYYLFPPKCWNC